MYQIGESVMKTHTGLCRITDIVHLEGRGIDKNTLYYLLIPFSDEKARIYVAVDQPKNNLRKVITKDAAWKLIEKIPYIHPVTIDNEKQREQVYKEAIKSCDPEQWVSIIKTMYIRKQKRSAQGKKGTSMDETYFKLSEDYLYSELAFVLGKDKKELVSIIAQYCQKKDMNV